MVIATLCLLQLVTSKRVYDQRLSAEKLPLDLSLLGDVGDAAMVTQREQTRFIPALSQAQRAAPASSVVDISALNRSSKPRRPVRGARVVDSFEEYSDKMLAADGVEMRMEASRREPTDWPALRIRLHALLRNEMIKLAVKIGASADGGARISASTALSKRSLLEVILARLTEQINRPLPSWTHEVGDIAFLSSGAFVFLYITDGDVIVADLDILCGRSSKGELLESILSNELERLPSGS